MHLTYCAWSSEQQFAVLETLSQFISVLLQQAGAFGVFCTHAHSYFTEAHCYVEFSEDMSDPRFSFPYFATVFYRFLPLMEAGKRH